MNQENKRVIRLKEQIKEYNEATSDTIVEIFPGFSERFNFLIDLTDLDVPKLYNGRQAYISSLLQVSKMAPGDWLKKDKLPKASTLRKLLTYFLRHIEGSYSVYQIEAWLKYGNEVVPHPFKDIPFHNQQLTSLAVTLIVAVASERSIPTTQFDLNKVLAATLETLSEFEITQESKIKSTHRKIIFQHITTYLK